MIDPHTALAATLHRFTQVFPADASRAAAAFHFLSTRPADPTFRSTTPGHFTASAMILNPASDATLLIFHKRLTRWLQPGGHIEPGESPLRAAIREAHEELGIPQNTLHLHPWHAAHTDPVPIDIDSHSIPANPQKNEPAHTHHDLLYLFLTDPATPLHLEPTEVTAARWVYLADLPPGDRLHHVATRLALAGIQS